MEFINKLKERNKKISYYDLNSLNELLKSGLSIKNSLNLIKTKNNEEIFDILISRLNKGNLIEEIIIDYLPKSIGAYLKPLIKKMTFIQSLDLALSFYKENNDNSKTIEKAVLYPLVLMFIAISFIYLFDTYGLDTLFNMIKNFNPDLKSFSFIRIILRIIVYIFYFGMLISFGIIFYFSREKNITLFYILIAAYLPNSLIHVYYCEKFISLFLICLDLGYKTKEALEILKALHNEPIISFLAFHMDEKLLEGNSLKEASMQNYFDETLSKFINVAIHTNDFSHILEEYISLSKEKILISMKKLVNIIQISSYLLVGMIIIFIYQVLFIPMQIINSF